MSHLSPALLLLCGLLAFPAFAGGGVSVDANAGKGLYSLLSIAELELGPSLNLNGGYGVTRLAELSADPANGLPAFQPAPIHQLLLGADWGFSRRWVLSALAQVELPSSNTVPISDGGLVRSLSLETSRRSEGGLLILAYDRGGWSSFEPGGDLSLSVAHSGFNTRFNARTQSVDQADALWIFRPAFSLRGTVRLDTNFTFRVTPTFYSVDPLQAGRFSDAEIARIEAAASRPLGSSLRRVAARLDRIEARLLQADAVSGLSSAPLRLELRPQVSHRFARWLRGQLAYGYLLYVSGQGRAHVISTRWTFSPGARFRIWATAALQLETPQGLPTTPYGVFGLGGEVSF